MRPYALLLVPALVLALTGCGDEEAIGNPPAPPTAPTPGQPDVDAQALIGLWEVSGDDVRPGTDLRLDGYGLTVFQDCGLLMGSYDAAGDQHLMSAQVDSGSGECDLDLAVSAPWLPAVTGFRIDGDQAVLLDTTGTAIARLAPGAMPTPRPGVIRDAFAPPTPAPEQLASLVVPAALPAAATAPTADQLAGRWTVPDDGVQRSSVPGVEFRDDGTWVASDGCNGSGGRWVLGAHGRLLARSGGSTLIGCENVSVGGWVSEAARVGIVGGSLVFYGPDGAELGRVTRSSGS